MITIENNSLFFDACSTVELAKKYGTPLYLVSENMIRNKCRIIHEDFLDPYDSTKAVYAAKAFLPIAMCKIIESENLGLDVVSGGELFTALQANFPPHRIEFNGNNKSRDELELAVSNKIGRIIVDNAYELDLLEQVCSELNQPISILFRIVPETETDTHEYISTGHKDSKFGVALHEDYFFKILEKALASDYIDFKGIHFHVGSQLHDNHAHINAINKTLHLIKDIKMKYNFDIKELNIGGGFGIHYTEADKVKPLKYFVDPAMKAIESFCLAHDLLRPLIIIEPGRWIIGEAGITLYEVGAIKTTANQKKYVSVNGGMNDNIRPSLYKARYEAILANQVDGNHKEIVTISGKFCESSDILIKDIELPIVASGDILAITSTGAYNQSMASNYNKNVIPPVVLLNKGKDTLIVKKQDYRDMIRNEVIPPYLANF